MLLFNGHIHLSELIDCCSTLRHDVVFTGVTNKLQQMQAASFPNNNRWTSW